MKVSKSLSIMSILLVLTVSCNSGPVKKHGQLRVEGKNLLDKSGSRVMLQGVSYGWLNYHPRFYNKESVKWLAEDWNCSVVRAAMGVEPKNAYLEKPEWSREKIETIVEAAIENDIYMLLLTGTAMGFS